MAGLELVKYDVNEAAISKMASIYMELTVKDIEDKEGFDSVHTARMVMVKHRTSIDKTRKKANEEAQVFIKNNNANAKRLLDLMAPIEDHLTKEEDKVTKEKERIKAEQEAKDRAKIEARINGLLQYGVVKPFMEVATMGDGEYDALLFTAKTAWEAEQKRLADEKTRIEAEKAEIEKARKEEAARLEEQRRVQETERLRLEAIRKEQEEATKKIEADKKAIEDEKRKVQEQKDREAFEKQVAENARVKAEKEAKEKAEREAREKKEREEAEATEKLRQEALRPDKEKLFAFSDSLLMFPKPACASPAAEEILIAAINNIRKISTTVRKMAEAL